LYTNTSSTLSKFFYQYTVTHRHLHSFPTRRSSDLTRPTSSGLTLRIRPAGISTNWRSNSAFTPSPSKIAATNTSAPKSKNIRARSEEHTSELQSLTNLVCRLLLEKQKAGKLLLYTL